MRGFPENDLQAVPSVESYRPSNISLLRDHEIRIQFLSRGCVIYVGCKSIAFEDVQLAMNELNKYVNNPYEEQQAWHKLLD
jgi:hypothetical protein